MQKIYSPYNGKSCGDYHLRLGIFSQFEPFDGQKYSSWIDALGDLMVKKLSYERGERDLVLLEHRVEAQKDGKLQRAVSSLVVYGEPYGVDDGNHEAPWRSTKSAMSKTVGYPVAIAADLILSINIRKKLMT